MKIIQLLYAKNTISWKMGVAEQRLEFFILVENLAYSKKVDVVWAGRDGSWKELQAEFHSSAGENRERWRACASFRPFNGGLPGNIRFALRCRMMNMEYWDNNHRQDYSIDGDSGIFVPEGMPFSAIGYRESLERGEKSYPVTIAVHHSLGSARVGITWTTDNWKTRHESRCFFKKAYWYEEYRSHAENPNKYGWLIWKGQIDVKDVYRIEYAVFCDNGRERIWDNNFGRNFRAGRERLKVLTLNLHCYQEENQDEKFSRIARAISDLRIDVVCFQEVGEKWNQGRGDRESNAAMIIRDRLKRWYHLHYHLYTDWSHIGFDKYREGSAILSRYKFLAVDSRYVSNSNDPYDINSRKVVGGLVHVPYMGYLKVFSAHLSWWSAGFREQFESLRRWIEEQHKDYRAATLLCGDFNSKAGSEGYIQVVGKKEYEDQFLRAVSPELFKRIFGNSPKDWHWLQDDHRIDYIFLKGGGKLKAIRARVLFTENDYGRVSDHLGYVVEFEPG
jgi:maltose 6'-phosphate phosphatase